MIARDSHSEYVKRMRRVIEHIDQHLDEPLELNTLAKVAHFSSFHFHRLFSAWMGETLGDPKTGVFECDLCIPVVAL